MVASGGAIVGLYPRRVGEVKWIKKITFYMSKKGVGSKCALCLHRVIRPWPANPRVKRAT